MHIDPTSTIAGHPSLEVRRLLRRLGGDFRDLGSIAGWLRMPEARARRLVSALCRLGYLEPDPTAPTGSWWRRTLQGSALAMASAAPPLRRATAERKLQDLLTRVAEVNRRRHFLFRVTKVVVFGSYLSERDRLNDVDVAIGLAPKERDPHRHFHLEQARTAQALRGGRRFNNVIDQLRWPQREVELFLKSRSRALSVHDFKDGILQQTEYRVVFDEGEEGPAR